MSNCPYVTCPPMGLNPGKRPRKLADMSVQPSQFVYERRPEAELTIDAPILLSKEGDVLHQREWTFRGRIVDFALNHYLSDNHPENPGDQTVDVARVDTCHNEVHRHQFYRCGRQDHRAVIKNLADAGSLEEAEKIIADCYDPCYLDLANNWEENLSRWRE